VIEDNNKSALTKAITQAAICYLDERGCKPIETEVPVAASWVADVAAALAPTMTDLIQLKLIKRRPGYNGPGYDEWADQLRKAQKLMTVIVEVKISKSDFVGDHKWKEKLPADLCYLAIPSGLALGAEGLPLGWGSLVYSEPSHSLRCSRVPMAAEVSTEQQLATILQIALRRDNHTRYARQREFNQAIRIEQNKEISRTRITRALQAMLAIARGKHGTIQGVFDWYGIKHVPEYLNKELAELWAIASENTRQKTARKEVFMGERIA